MKTVEANFDGLVGPTHCYAGLSFGNIASTSHRNTISNPKEAALQGLSKAKALMDLGFVQGILPPQQRPDIEALKNLGFIGTDAEILQTAFKKNPELLAACASASSMWTANAATVSPSADCFDKKVHMTPANLNQKLHRSLESKTTSRILKSIFRSEDHFVHHDPLSGSDTLGDEGAANHTRLTSSYGHKGLELFVYGREALSPHQLLPKKYPARQTKEASLSVARLHQVENAIFIQQNPQCIDNGAFHNDVVAVGNLNTLFYHESAFCDSDQVIEQIKKFVDLDQISVSEFQVPLADAVKSYLFNSQLLTLPSGETLLVAPQDCEEIASVKNYLRSSPFKNIKYFDLRQSMSNGGGPACLRLRVVLNEQELVHVNKNCLLNEQKASELESWVNRHYRDRLELKDLSDIEFYRESLTALEELTRILDLKGVYRF